MGRGLVESAETTKPRPGHFFGPSIFVDGAHLLDHTLGYLGVHTGTAERADGQSASRAASLDLVGGQLSGEPLVVDKADGFQVIERFLRLFLRIPGAEQTPRELGAAPGPVSEEAQRSIFRRAAAGRGHVARLSRSAPVLAVSPGRL